MSFMYGLQSFCRIPLVTSDSYTSRNRKVAITENETAAATAIPPSHMLVKSIAQRKKIPITISQKLNPKRINLISVFSKAISNTTIDPL